MRLLTTAVVASLLVACTPVSESKLMFTTADFVHLKFLEGRWEGTAPDGNPFYEEYSFVSDSEMRSRRYADSTFSEAQDGSTVVLHEGRVTSTWQDFTWQAAELAEGRACFTPVAAPSSFCWERLSDDSAQVTQRWTDEQGQEQHYVVPLRRLAL